MEVPNFHDDLGGWPVVGFCLVADIIAIAVASWLGWIPWPT